MLKNTFLDVHNYHGPPPTAAYPPGPPPATVYPPGPNPNYYGPPPTQVPPPYPGYGATQTTIIVENPDVIVIGKELSYFKFAL